jgi:ferredoxin-NADP reductase
MCKFGAGQNAGCNGMKSATVSIKNILPEASGTITLLLEKPKDFSYFAGQYIRVLLYDSKGNKQSRFFSLSSYPEQDFLQITVKIRKSPFRKLLYQLKTGDRIEIFGPIGKFYVNGDSQGEYVFIAGGIGIAPFNSMIWHLYHNNLPVTMRLYASFKKTRDICFADKLKSLDNKKLQVTITVSQNNGRLKASDLKIPLHNKKFFISGKETFVNAWRESLEKLQIAREQIYYETFYDA